ncbi:hypothetical protein CHU33_09705 [Superficieibacter electus]|uniref:Uncharacterized protein n=1 Tax=Superficieibacter electus TaxID=2022662 RepID=A0ABX4ZES8_9ENTR|nr:hypothetical protein CHU33_09705 [Superficieibacter electus]
MPFGNMACITDFEALKEKLSTKGIGWITLEGHCLTKLLYGLYIKPSSALTHLRRLKANFILTECKFWDAAPETALNQDR